jgi:glycosyltransferase involved in cell wall biosynthesis
LKLFILTDTRIVNIKDKDCIFNAVKYELEAIESLFSNVSILGVKYKNITETKTLEQCNKNWEVSSLVFPRDESIIFLICFAIKLFVYSFVKVAKADVIHVRGPGIPMFVGLLMSVFFPRKKWWFKYANDWSSWGRSTFWDIQKKLLLNFKWIKVTVNGTWPGQAKHVLSFENPCVWVVDNKITKSYESDEINKIRAFSCVFVGRLTNEKGVLIALRALEKICKDYSEKFKFKFTVIGNGTLKNILSTYKSKNTNLEFIFLGSMAKTEIFEYYKSHDFVILPTSSPEGFPKSLAEGMAFGCIPIVTSISSIPQYIRHFENGLLLSLCDIEKDLYDCLRELCFLDRNALLGLKNGAVELSHKYFTYARFVKRVNCKILS